MFDSIKPAQDIHDFHQKISESKGKIRYTDYEMIQNIRKQDIPEMKKTLETNIAYNKTLKKPDGTPLFTPEEINIQNKEWQRYLDSVNTLEQSWQKGTLEIENHQEERYAETKNRTQIKLKELFGEFKQSHQTQVPTQNPTQTTILAGNISNSNSEGEKLLLEQKLQNIQGKLDEYVKSKGLESILINKIAGNSSNGGIDNLMVTVTEKTQPPYINGEVYSFDGILLKGGIVSTRMKNDSDLVNEIIQKIEGRNNKQETRQVIEGATDASPLEINQPPASTTRIERRELSDTEVLERNKRYIKEYNIGSETNDGLTDETLQGYIDVPTRANIKELQKYIKYPRTPDGIMGPITKKAILDFLGRKESGNDRNESLSNSNKIGFSREGGKILLNTRDTTGNIIQKLSYEDIMKLSGKEGKLTEIQKGELNQLILLSTLGDIWIQAASKDMDTMMFGSFRSGGKEEYKKQIGGISEYINSLQAKFQKGESIQGDIAYAYNKFNFANSSTGGLTPPIAINDLRRALDIVQSGGSLDTRRASILKTLSSKFDSTTTEAVKSTAMTEVLGMNDFKDLRTKFEDPAFMDQFIGASRDEMKAILMTSPYSLNESGSKDLISEIEKTRAGINSRKNEIEKTLKQQGVAPAKIKEQVDGAEKIAVQLVISNHIIDSKINSLSGGFVDAYKQSRSDLTWNKAIDISVQLAISLVPMGAGLLAARGALALGRGAMAMKVGNVIPNMAKGNVGKFIGTSAVEGIGFYEGFNLTNNLVHNQDTNNKLGGLLEGALDVKEIMKSVAMIGVIRGLGMIPGQKIDAMLLKDSTKMKQFALEAGKVAGISAAVVGTSQGVEAMFGEGFQPTPEEFAQAVIMTALFRRFGNRKNTESAQPKNTIDYNLNGNKPSENILLNKTKINSKGNADSIKESSKFKDTNGQEWYVTRVTGKDGLEGKITIRREGDTKGKNITFDEFDALFKKPETNNTPKKGEKNKSKNTDTETVNKDAENRGKKIKRSRKLQDGEIGSKIQKNPEAIFRGLRDTTNGGNKVKALEDAMKVNNTLGRENVGDLLVARGRVERIETGKDPEFTQAKTDLLSYFDTQITLKSPKQSFVDRASATKWINENKGKIGVGLTIAVAGTIYLTQKTNDGNIEIRPAPEPGVGSIDLMPLEEVEEGTINTPVKVATISPVVKNGTIDIPK